MGYPIPRRQCERLLALLANNSGECITMDHSCSYYIYHSMSQAIRAICHGYKLLCTCYTYTHDTNPAPPDVTREPLTSCQTQFKVSSATNCWIGCMFYKTCWWNRLTYIRIKKGIYADLEASKHSSVLEGKRPFHALLVQRISAFTVGQGPKPRLVRVACLPCPRSVAWSQLRSAKEVGKPGVEPPAKRRTSARNMGKCMKFI